MITINRVNQSYGRLKVVSLLYETAVDIYWNCLCSCGKNITIREKSIKAGTSSCGCLEVEQARSKRAGQETSKDSAPLIPAAIFTKPKWYKKLKVSWVQSVNLVLTLALLTFHISKIISLQTTPSVLESSVKAKTFSKAKK